MTQERFVREEDQADAAPLAHLEEAIKQVPIYKHAKAVMYCAQHKTFPVADHEIWVARVLHIDLLASPPSENAPDLQSCDQELKEMIDSISASTLVYQNRRFHRIGSDLSEQ